MRKEEAKKKRRINRCQKKQKKHGDFLKVTDDDEVCSFRVTEYGKRMLEENEFDGLDDDHIKILKMIDRECKINSLRIVAK